MITITRSLARHLRAVFRRTGVGRSNHSAWLALLAEPDALRVRLKTEHVALEHHTSGQFQPERLSLPLEFLADCEGRKDEPVTLEPQANGRVLVSWSDRGVPQMVQYDTEPTGGQQEFPALPQQLQAVNPDLWPALADAAQVTDRERIRYALDCLQLRGASGQITATNGSHIFIQSGYSFPWQDDVLTPASSLLGCPELASQHTFTLGRTDDWLTLVAGPWSVFLRIEKEARFPKLDDLFRPADQACSRLHLEPTDARFLADVLPRLPRGEETNHPVTLDLNGQVVIRAADQEQTRITELTLTNSRSSGDPIIINTNRNFLLRAAKLGFQEVCLYGPEAPLQCDDGRRKYLWAVLDAKSALQPSENRICIASPAASGPEAATPATMIPLPTRRKRSTMPRKKKPNQALETTDEQASPSATETVGTGKTLGPIEKAQALRGALREAMTKTNELITSLKRQRRQSKLVETTLSALEELRSAG